jgi:hypothetical protein
MKTPVVFLIFNRPDTTEKVFNVIRQAKPQKLFVVADGPRAERANESEKCQATRAIVDRVDWECDVFTNYSEVNLGCKQRVSTGLDWVFRNVEEAIILEDDCIPDPSFFPFCEELLAYYRDDRRIMAISGDNFQFGRKRSLYSYYFSRYPHCWGWATWRRAWRCYDERMQLWSKSQQENWLGKILDDPKAVKYWTRIFQATYDGSIDSWAYRWTFACWVQSGLTILPQVNLVSNIGFGASGTHTRRSQEIFAHLPIEMMDFPMLHPPYVIRDAQADRFTSSIMFELSLTQRIKQKLARTIESFGARTQES